MISKETFDAYNAKMTVNPNNIKKMSPAQRDAVIVWGTQAENLLRHRDLAQFMHEYKFELCDQLVDIVGHTAEADARRIAVSNQIAGLDGFVVLLKRAMHYKNQAVSIRDNVEAPPVNKEIE
tara:strand:- start:338 stop:703 length:366 start_codon:yes stop_codon:yes gene_type:complete